MNKFDSSMPISKVEITNDTLTGWGGLTPLSDIWLNPDLSKKLLRFAKQTGELSVAPAGA